VGLFWIYGSRQHANTFTAFQEVTSCDLGESLWLIQGIL